MDKDEKDESIFTQISGFEPVDPQSIVEFERAMTDQVIPDIVRALEDRRMRAAESRERQLKY
jgi:hypothetical protein